MFGPGLWGGSAGPGDDRRCPRGSGRPAVRALCACRIVPGAAGRQVCATRRFRSPASLATLRDCRMAIADGIGLPSPGTCTAAAAPVVSRDMQPRRHRKRRRQRRASAGEWVGSGATVVIKAYAKRYGVDRYTVFDDLSALGSNRPPPSSGGSTARRRPHVARPNPVPTRPTAPGGSCSMAGCCSSRATPRAGRGTAPSPTSCHHPCGDPC
jgi:hypothetical protein